MRTLRAVVVILLIGGAWARAADTQKAVPLTGDLLKPHERLAGVAVAGAQPKVDICILENLPDGGKGCLWSSWGDGCIASNGRFYFAIGNHLEQIDGRQSGESRIYEYNPADSSVRLALNIRDVLTDPTIDGGKIHAALQEAADGWLYFVTHRGKSRAKDPAYKGSALLRFDPRTGKGEFLGVPVPQQTTPIAFTDPRRLIMHCYAADSGDLVVYDINARRILWRGAGDTQEGGRSMMFDADGNAYFSTKNGTLARLDASNQLKTLDIRLPGGSAGEKRGPFLRAATRMSSRGIIYGATNVGRAFAFNTKTQTIEDLGPTVAGGQYTAVLVLSPDEKYVYYAPGSHGQAAGFGTPVVQYDIAARRHKVIAFLNAACRQQFNYNIAGTYATQISRDGATLYFCFNGAPVSDGKRDTFGKPCVAAVHIPAEER